MRDFVKSNRAYKMEYFRNILKSFRSKQVYLQDGVYISKHRDYTIWKVGKYGPVVLARRPTFAEAKGVLETCLA